MSSQNLSVIVLAVQDLEESLAFFTETLGFPLLKRVSPTYAMVDGGPIAIGLNATAPDGVVSGQTMLGMLTDDVDEVAKAVEETGGTIVKAPYDDGDERRVFVHDPSGNLLMAYKR